MDTEENGDGMLDSYLSVARDDVRDKAGPTLISSLSHSLDVVDDALRSPASHCSQYSGWFSVYCHDIPFNSHLTRKLS